MRVKDTNSKSGAIRRILEENPDMPPAAYRDRLAEAGVQVNTDLIRVVRRNWRGVAKDRDAQRGQERTGTQRVLQPRSAQRGRI